jgi:hypothetical protein
LVRDDARACGRQGDRHHQGQANALPARSHRFRP